MSSISNTLSQRRILIVDNHPLVRRGLIELIEGQSDLAVCGSIASHQAAAEALATTRPDLVITDLSLGQVDDCLKLVRYICKTYAGLPVLVLTMHTPLRYAELALQAGATGYVTKRAMTKTLLIAIQSVLAGERYVPPDLIPDQNLH